MQTPGEWDMAEIAAFYLVPSIPMFGICPFVLKHWIFKKNSKLHVHVLSKKPPKQQGHLMTCNVGANKYWVHVYVWFSNWLYNVQYCDRFWICSCLYGNNSDVAYLMNKTNTAVLIISYSTHQSYSMEDNQFFKECIVRLSSVKFMVLIKNISLFNEHPLKKYVAKDSIKLYSVITSGLHYQSWQVMYMHCRDACSFLLHESIVNTCKNFKSYVM